MKTYIVQLGYLGEQVTVPAGDHIEAAERASELLKEGELPVDAFVREIYTSETVKVTVRNYEDLADFV